MENPILRLAPHPPALQSVSPAEQAPPAAIQARKKPTARIKVIRSSTDQVTRYRAWKYLFRAAKSSLEADPVLPTTSNMSPSNEPIATAVFLPPINALALEIV